MFLNDKFESGVKFFLHNRQIGMLMRDLIRFFNWTLSILSIMGLIFFTSYGAIAQGTVPNPQSRDQQRCIMEINRRTAELGRANNKESLRCMRHAAHDHKSQLANVDQIATAQDCLTNDVKQRIAKKQRRFLERENKRCTKPEQIPDFAYTSAANAANAIKTASHSLVNDLFGPNLDSSLVLIKDNPDSARCQRQVLNWTTKVFDALWNQVNNGKKNALAGWQNLETGIGPLFPVEDPDALLQELDSFIKADPSNIISKTVSRLNSAVQNHCADEITTGAIPELFPGLCATSDLAECAEKLARCGVCESLAATDNLSIDCDLFDDTSANGSCSTGINSAIAELVDQVSQENIKNNIMTLSERPRYTPDEKTKALNHITEQLESFGYVVVPSKKDGVNVNLVAELKGTVVPDKVFIVGAHYDTVAGSKGADDNASGVAGMLEIARLLAGTSLAATVQFVAFDNEERGLIGSHLYAESLKDDGVEVIGMISLEMIAYTCDEPGCQLKKFSDIDTCLDVEPEDEGDGDFIAIVANTDSANMIVDFEAAASKFIPSLKFVTAKVADNGFCSHIIDAEVKAFARNTRRSDHASFWNFGFPAMMITDTANFRHPNYHKPGDNILETPLDFEFATNVVKATLATVVTTANIARSRLQQ